MLRSIVVVFCLCIVSCAAPYKEPIEGPISNLTVPNLGAGGIYDMGDVRLGLVGEDGCGKFSIVPKGDPEKQNITVKVQAGQQMFIELSKVVGNKACIISRWFSPKDNQDYKASFAIGSEECVMLLQEISPSGDVAAAKLNRAHVSRRDGVTVCK